MPSAGELLRFAGRAGLAALRSGGVSRRASAREAEAEQGFPPLGQVVEVGGLPVHVHAAGNGPEVMLIHGAGGNLRDFTFDLGPRLAARYRVIAADRPGHGHTAPAGPDDDGWLAAGESPAAQARLLRGAAAALGVNRPILVGHSYGASVALAWALDDPQAVAGLVLLGGATMPWPGGLAASYHVNASTLGGATLVPLITAFAGEAQLWAVLRTIFAPQPIPPGYAAHLGLPLSLRRASLRANARQVTALRPHVVAMAEHYAGLDLPVELVHGTADRIVPLKVHSRPLAALLPGAMLTELPGIGHMPHHAAPEAAVAAVDRVAARAGLHAGPGAASVLT